jgi:hypothetical protein
MLQQADRFQTDVKKYNEAIESMVEGPEKLEAKRLLNDLIHEVKNMDNMYVDMVYANQLPTMGNEMRDKIVSLRKQLSKKLKL